jgi:hypothetical protein
MQSDVTRTTYSQKTMNLIFETQKPDTWQPFALIGKNASENACLKICFKKESQ